jgi:hypothetical protein
MVKINRSSLPVGLEIKSEKDYQSGPVYDLLKSDFHDKCYICEDSTPDKIEIEHRSSHKGDAEKKYNWNNLFYSCGHCNHAKGTQYDDIIDCTQTDPEQYISLKLALRPETFVLVSKLADGAGVDKTIDLLERVYNGTTKQILNDECANKRKKIQQEIGTFQQKLISYLYETDDSLKPAWSAFIRKALSPDSAFAAFKRQIVRNDPALLAEFGSFL